jgi:hypothetical protein
MTVARARSWCGVAELGGDFDVTDRNSEVTEMEHVTLEVDRDGDPRVLPVRVVEVPIDEAMRDLLGFVLVDGAALVGVALVGLARDAQCLRDRVTCRCALARVRRASRDGAADCSLLPGLARAVRVSRQGLWRARRLAADRRGAERSRGAVMESKDMTSKRKGKGRDVVAELVALGEEMQRQGLGELRCGPHVETGLKFRIVVRKASDKERERARCKETTVRGGHVFQCRRSRRHAGRHLVKTSSGNVLFGEARSS